MGQKSHVCRQKTTHNKRSNNWYHDKLQPIRHRLVEPQCLYHPTNPAQRHHISTLSNTASFLRASFEPSTNSQRLLLQTLATYCYKNRQEYSAAIELCRWLAQHRPKILAVVLNPKCCCRVLQYLENCCILPE